MLSTFRAIEDPAENLLTQITSLAPENPFYTAAFVNVMRLKKYKPFIFLLEQNEQNVAGCTAFLKQGRLNRELTIISLPVIPDREVFWSELVRFCRSARISILEVNSFASPEADIETLAGEISRRTRYEYVIDLTNPELWQDLSSNHKRNIRRATKEGIKLRCAKDFEACQNHMRLIDLSMGRRRDRGEVVSNESKAEDYFAFIQNELGEIYQAMFDDTVLSSILILRSQMGAYYQSAGTSPDGMKRGASQFLIHEVANTLKSQSLSVFNLGGVDQFDEGLQRFKEGFGAKKVELESGKFYLGSKVKKKIGTAFDTLRHNPKDIIRSIVGMDSYLVYNSDPKKIAPPPQIEGMVLKKLSDEEISKSATENSLFIEHEKRVSRSGFNDAYGVFYGGKLANITWIVTADHDRTVSERNVKLKEEEAEITHALTLPEFRGKGIFGFAIKSLAQVASSLKIKQVYMITNKSNFASQKAIKKSGLVFKGRIIRLNFPLLKMDFTYRGHRLRV